MTKKTKLEQGVEELNGVMFDEDGRFADAEVYAAALNYFREEGLYWNVLGSADYDQVFAAMKQAAETLDWKLDDNAVHQIISYWRGDGPGIGV
jgi:translation elongation factor P/translation initiation factor 5A